MSWLNKKNFPFQNDSTVEHSIESTNTATLKLRNTYSNDDSLPNTNQEQLPLNSSDNRTTKEEVEDEQLQPLITRKSWDGFKGLIASGEKKDKPLKGTDDEINLPPDATMEDVVKETLRLMDIKNGSWMNSEDNQTIQIIFSMESNINCEKLLGMLSEWGVGEILGSSISVLPCTMYHKPHVSEPSEDGEEGKTPHSDESIANKESAWDRFISSIRARLNVAQIVEEVKKDARITFDFVCLIVVAA